jgi:hypothetical protein
LPIQHADEVNRLLRELFQHVESGRA